MASHPSSDPLDDSHEYTTNFPHHLRTRGVSPYTPNRATTIGATPTIPRRPPIPEVLFVRSLTQDFRLSDPQGELIDTAIVIKNIPFGYPEEEFINTLFPQLGLTPPYAFNYHRNRSDRAFHGLAFANFNAPHEAQAAVDTLNNYELSGRRLRVELKKRLPAEEEQRQRLARQSRRQLTSSTSGTIGIQEGSPGPSGGIPQELRYVGMGEMLDPQLRPKIVYREPSTPSPTAGIPFFACI
jgi:RNA recognition motif-containing protein